MKIYVKAETMETLRRQSLHGLVHGGEWDADRWRWCINIDDEVDAALKAINPTDYDAAIMRIAVRRPYRED